MGIKAGSLEKQQQKMCIKCIIGTTSINCSFLVFFNFFAAHFHVEKKVETKKNYFGNLIDLVVYLRFSAKKYVFFVVDEKEENSL